MNQNAQEYEHLYHYTRLSTLEKIFFDHEGDLVELQFTDYHFLNDEDEGQWLYKLFRDYEKDIVDEFDESEKLACKKGIDDFVEFEYFKGLLKEQKNKFYSFSLSELKDSMLFWRQDYANENGIALGFNKTKFEETYSQKIEKIRYLGIDNVKSCLPSFVDAVKRDSKYIKKRSDLKDEVLVNQLDAAKILAKVDFSRIKNQTWESEKEWRIIVSNLRCDYDCHVDDRKNEFEKGRFEIDANCIPRYRVKIKNPFDEIILGPNFSRYYVDSVREWLKQHKYENIKVSNSLGHERYRP
jgi:hypothetical protein